MSAPHRTDYPALWKAQAEILDACGHFSKYPAERREEVLRKGYVGNENPETALRLAAEKLESGTAKYTSKVLRELEDHYQVLGTEDRRAFLMERTKEAQPDDYEPPHNLDEPPGYPYLFESPGLHSDVYLKFGIEIDGKKCRVAFISCHPPRRQRKVQ